MKRHVHRQLKAGAAFAAAALLSLHTAATVSLPAGGMYVSAAEAQEATIHLEDLQVYSAEKGKTIVTVPIIANGAVDLQCYDFTVTYDSSVLTLQDDGTDLTGINSPGGYQEIDVSTPGEIRIVGADLSDAAAAADGEIGQLTFVLCKKITKTVATGGESVSLSIGVNELGFGTEAAQTVTQGATITFYKDALETEAPAETETPAPTETAEPTGTPAETKTPAPAEETPDTQSPPPTENAVVTQTPAPTADMTETGVPAVYYYGDVDLDGELTAGDALHILRHCVMLKQLTQLPLLLADANQDNKITSSDALSVLMVCVNLKEKMICAEAGAQSLSTLLSETTYVGTNTQTAYGWSVPVLLDKGDLVSDSRYTVRDSLRAWQIAEDLHEADPSLSDRADVNSDGVVNSQDVVMLLQAALGRYTNFGYEAPAEEDVLYVDSGSLTMGGYCFKTLGEALAYVNANPPASEDERITLLFAPGDYREYTILTAPYITYEAMYPGAQELPNLTFYYGCGRYYESVEDGMETVDANYASTVISATAHDFIARNMRFENSYNLYITYEERSDYLDYTKYTLAAREADITASAQQTQALALRVDADRCSFFDCEIIGRQDTLLMHNSNRVYYEDCYIEGTVDFIYGSGVAVFDSCTINSPYRSGHITAAATPANQPYGFLFKDCVLTRNATTTSDPPKDASYTLGRPWNNPAMVVYYNCRMDAHITTKNTPDSDRFVRMGSSTATLPENCRYAEYGTMDIEGTLIDLEEVVPDYETILTEADFEGFYAPYQWLCRRYDPSTGAVETDDGWNPGDYPAFQ